MSSDQEDTGRGARCICGHYRTEHETRARVYAETGAACNGAYATLMADADDFESVEVRCKCEGFYESPYAFEVR
jgi:hypothetical protein